MQKLLRLVFSSCFRLRTSQLTLAFLLAAGVSILSIETSTWAAVFASGDVAPKQTFVDVNIGGQLVTLVVPDLPSAGGRLEGDDGMGGMEDLDLIVGGTGTFSGNLTFGIGTTIGEVTINNPTGTLPLVAANVVIGMESVGIGRINLNDFGTTLVAEVMLTVGEEGVGELKLTNGSRVGVGIFNIDPMVLKYEGGTTVIGSQRETTGANQFLSEGLVTIDGFGSKLETDDLTVAADGQGAIEISGKGNLSTIDTTIGLNADSNGRVTLTGLGTRWVNINDLVIGDSGNGTLELNDSAVAVSDTVTIGATSFVNMNGGTLISNSSISNSGIIRGDGRIESDLAISSSGELRNAAGVSSLREYMLVTGTVTNDGTIESLGGEMEFQSAVTNNLELIARDAVMRFNAGLTNTTTGDIVLGGETTLHTGTLLSEGGIHVLANSEALLVGDLTFTASSTLSLTIGAAAGTLDVFGSVDIGSALLELDYSAGIASQVNDTYLILSSTEPIMGTFANALDVVMADGREWDIIYGTNSVSVTATGTMAPVIAGDFEADDDVDGMDFLRWQRGFGPTPSGIYDANDLADWANGFGSLPGPIVAAATIGAIPEPTSLALLMLGGVLFAGRRSRKAS